MKTLLMISLSLLLLACVGNCSVSPLRSMLLSDGPFTLDSLIKIYCSCNLRTVQMLPDRCVTAQAFDCEDFPRCLSPGQLFNVHGFEQPISKDQFLTLLPDVLDMVALNACHQSQPQVASLLGRKSRALGLEMLSDDHDHDDDDHDHPVDSAVWQASFVAILIVSSLAILGPCLIPCLGQSWTAVLLDILISLGAGVLLGDAFLHLIPSALGVHSHEHPVNATMAGLLEPAALDADHLTFLWISLTTVLVIYVLFLVEKNVMEYFGFGHSGGSGHTHSHSADHSHEHHSHEHHSHRARSPHTSGPDDEESGPLLVSGNGDTKRRGSIISTNGVEVRHGGQNQSKGASDGGYSSISSTTPHQLDSGVPTKTLPRSVGWFIFFADFVHNFIDGVVIGASFAVSFDSGLSTTLAVILHEIPHEIADFAIIVSAGFSKKAAVAMTFVDQLTGFLGVYIGVVLGNDEVIVRYIIAATAGIFIYLALVDMFPLIEFFPGRDTAPKAALRHTAILVGIFLMVVISVVEELTGG